MSPELVGRLLSVQHPDLAGLPITVMANGWDNLMCRLGEELAVRLPRRALAATLVEHEQRWLPVLAPALPLPVPAPVRNGRPELGYPWAWSVVPFLPGQVAAVRPPADPSQAAASLGSFLAALHTPADAAAPVNPFRGIPLRDRLDSDMRNLTMVEATVDRAEVLRLWQTALDARAWDGPAMWLHGDLHPANILVHQGKLSGVIDFGDITSGDPAADLSVAWMLLPQASHEAFRAAYTAAACYRVTGDLWLRARGWALVLALVFLAHSADNPQQAGIGDRALRALLSS